MSTLIGIITFFSILGLIGLYTLLAFRYYYTPLVKKFRSEKDFLGTHLYLAGVRINGLRFTNNLFCAYNAEGLYLYANWPMRHFYPPVLIPWEEVAEGKDNKYVIGKPKMVTLSIEIGKRNPVDELPKQRKFELY